LARRSKSTNCSDWLIWLNSDKSGIGVVLIGCSNGHVVRTTPVR
jgi:hypothetical protein